MGMTPILLYLKTCINAGYYLLVVPVKIKIVPECGISNASLVFKKYTNPIQKAVCGVVYFSVLMHQIFFPSDVRTLMPAAYGPFSYLGLYRKILSIWYVVCALDIFWRRHEPLLHIFRVVQRSQFTACNSHQRNLVKVIIILSHVWLIYVLPLELFMDVGDKGNIGLHLNATTALNRLYSRSQTMLLRNAKDVEILSFTSITCIQALQCSLYFILFFFTSWIQTTLELVVLLMIFLMWHYVTLFEKWYEELDPKLEQGGGNLLKIIVSQYDNVKEVLWTTNKFLGPAIVIVIALYLPIYAVYAGLITIKEKFSIPALITVVFHYGIYILQITTAAEVHRKGNEFIRWASSPRFLDSLSAGRLTSLSMDLTSHQIALKGSGCFSLSYRLLSSILGVMITYAILVVQFQDKRNEYITNTLGNKSNPFLKIGNE